MEQIDFWTYTVKDGKVYIYFDKNTKYIEILEKDLKSMINWIYMDKGIYYTQGLK